MTNEPGSGGSGPPAREDVANTALFQRSWARCRSRLIRRSRRRVRRAFSSIEQYDQIDELILTGGGCNIPLVRDAIRQELERYHLKKSHIPVQSRSIFLPDARSWKESSFEVRRQSTPRVFSSTTTEMRGTREVAVDRVGSVTEESSACS